MKLRDYYSENDGFIQFSREQASRFAKNVAGDFNPIHDPDSKRFCVPGDLLFACSLANFGLSEKMHVRFSGMVGAGVALDYRPSDAPVIPITNDNGKEFLTITRSGKQTDNPSLIANLTQQYVAFSGFTFPHVLVPLMAAQQVMVNPARPLIIYESMEINLQTLDLQSVSLEQCETRLAVSGKRGDAMLKFRLKSDGETVGSGYKTMVLSGLKPYNEAEMNALVENYQSTKSAAAA
ncbi:MAG: DUF3581 domain-containing protein [Gammaproteobacteria bacterium]|nr:DUF3581 domain-containing protein [Gammaproteobacteria bacterium]